MPKREKIYSFLCGLGFFWYEQKAESILLTLLYKVNALHTLARNLMQLIAPGAPETGAGAAQTAAPAQTGGAPNAVEELKQYIQFNLIPHTCTGKKTRCYAIKKSDVIAFMNDREVNPEKYIAPKNWYKYGSEMVRPYKIRIHPPCAKDEKKLRRYYESKLAALPDVMDVAAAVDFTGYNRRTVCQWIRVGKLKALALLQKYMIPKCYLIDWLCSDDYNNTNRKSRRHIDMLWEAQKWRDGR